VLVFELPPQTIAEQAFFEPSSTKPQANSAADVTADAARAKDDLPPGAVAKARIGRPARLVFRLPDDVSSLPLSIDGLLAWDSLEPVLSPLASLPRELTAAELSAAPEISEPEPLQTSIELPYRLLLSPNTDGRWIHTAAPVTHSGRTELWHTRLGAVDADGVISEASYAAPSPLRAIWSPDYHAGAAPDKKADDPDLGTSAMNPNDRHQIVTLTSDYSNFRRFNVPPVQPSPIDADQLMLSALGGWLRSRGHWDLPEGAGEEPRPRRGQAAEQVLQLPVSRAIPVQQGLLAVLKDEGVFARAPTDNLDLTEWVHVGTQGRDHYVRLVYDGCLFPLGHRASLVKITERRFEEIDGAPVALLRQFVYVIVRQPVRNYPRAAYPHSGREMPFTQIELKTPVTHPRDSLKRSFRANTTTCSTQSEAASSQKVW
jgi:hypothetical protein